MPGVGLVTVRSAYGPEETMNRLEAELASRGMTVFARIDHTAGAEAAGGRQDEDEIAGSHSITEYASPLSEVLTHWPSFPTPWKRR